MRALRDMNLPKFVFEDVPLFLGLISDLFPGLDCPRVRYPSFNDAVEDTLQENKYIVLPNQVIRPFKTHSQWIVMIKCTDSWLNCECRWTKWCKCMRPWWPDTQPWWLDQQEEGSLWWSTHSANHRPGLYLLINNIYIFSTYTECLEILLHVHKQVVLPGKYT